MEAARKTLTLGDDLQNKLSHGRQAYEQGNLKGAEQGLNQMLKQRPAQPDCYAAEKEQAAQLLGQIRERRRAEQEEQDHIRKDEAARRWAADQESIRREEERRRQEEAIRIQQEEAARRQAEADQRRQWEEDRRRRAQEDKIRRDEAARRQAEDEERRKREEDRRRRAAEDDRIQKEREAQQRQRAEEDRRRLEEQRRRDAEASRRHEPTPNFDDLNRTPPRANPPKPAPAVIHRPNYDGEIRNLQRQIQGLQGEKQREAQRLRCLEDGKRRYPRTDLDCNGSFMIGVRDGHIDRARRRLPEIDREIVRAQQRIAELQALSARR